MATLEIHQIAVLSDNYVWLLREPESGDCADVVPVFAEFRHCRGHF